MLVSMKNTQVAGLVGHQKSLGRVSRCFRPAVTMMMTTEPGYGRFGFGIENAFRRLVRQSVLVQADVSSVLMVIRY